MSAVPARYLKKMGSCRNLNVHGQIVTVIVDTADSDTVTEQHLSEFKTHVRCNNTVLVVGVDAKQKSIPTTTTTDTMCPKKFLLALYSTTRCLILHLGCSYYRSDCANIPESVYNFFNDPNICFVGPLTTLEQTFIYFVKMNSGNKSSCGINNWNSLVVPAEELAARALKKPNLTTSTLAAIAREVGVLYDGPETGTGHGIEVDSRNSMVLTEDMIKKTINNAVAHYLIGFKLLSTIDQQEY